MRSGQRGQSPRSPRQSLRCEGRSAYESSSFQGDLLEMRLIASQIIMKANTAKKPTTHAKKSRRFLTSTSATVSDSCSACPMMEMRARLPVRTIDQPCLISLQVRWPRIHPPTPVKEYARRIATPKERACTIIMLATCSIGRNISKGLSMWLACDVCDCAAIIPTIAPAAAPPPPLIPGMVDDPD